MSTAVVVSIIIPTYNALSKLSRALESIEKIDFPIDHFEVIVVDDGSLDNTENYVKNMAARSRLHLRYVYQKNRGPAAARNVGIRLASGKYVLIIDSDCFVDRAILKSYLVHYPDESLGGVGGDVLPDSVNMVTKYLDYIGVWRPGRINGDIVYLVTANAFFQKQAIVDAGYFDEDFRLPGGEEPELCHRMIKKGYSFSYDRSAVVVHSHRTSIKMLMKMSLIHGKGYAIFVNKWPDDLKARPWLRRCLFGWEAYMKFKMNYRRDMGLRTALIFFFLEYLRAVAFAFGYRSKMNEIKN